MTQKIPIVILTGFLGAGKTTVLNRILNAEHNQNIAVMVNDFGAVNIDAQLVLDVDEADEVVNLSNGCVCCTIRGDLVNAALNLVNRDPQPDLLVLETSGVSDPIDVVLTLRAVEKLKIDSVITVLDAEQVLDAVSEYEILALNQIGTADIILLNKIDLVDEMQLQNVKSYVQGIAPKARIIETLRGDVPLEIILGAGQFDEASLQEQSAQSVHVHNSNTEHHHHDDHTLIFDTWSWSTDKAISYKALKRAINQLPDAIYRAKGFFFLADEPDKRAILHVVGKRVELMMEVKTESTQTTSQLVIIGKHNTYHTDELQSLFDGTLAIHAPENEVERLTNAALAWLRNRRS